MKAKAKRTSKVRHFPHVVACETSVTDLIYQGGNEALKAQFFTELPELLAKTEHGRGCLNAAPRAGDNILVPAEAWDEALLAFGTKHRLIPRYVMSILSAEETAQKQRDAVSAALFGTPTLQAGGSLANSFDAIIHSTLNEKKLVGGTFITAVGDDAAGKAFADSLQGHLAATVGGRQMVAHVIPVGKDRIIVATPSKTHPCDAYLDATMLNDPAILNAQTDMVMLGGYLFYTPHFDAVLDAALARIESLNVEREAVGRKPIKLVITCAAQGVANSKHFQDAVIRASSVTDVMVHANTGEFRRLMDLDGDWRTPFEAQWQGKEGAALEQAKQANEAYQAAKVTATMEAIEQGAKLARLQAAPTGQFPSHRQTQLQFIITNGAKGSYVADALGYREYPTAKIDRRRIVNTVGAGDNFAAGYELGVLLGFNEKQSIQLAGAFAGAVIQQDPPRLSASASHSFSSDTQALVAGGALATLPNTRANRLLLERLAPTTTRQIG